MSTLKVNKLRDTAGSADAITLDPNGGAVLAGVTTVTSVKVGAAVTISESGIEASGIGITCASINGTQIGGRRNLIINGAMLVAQRGTTSTSSGIYTVDRFNVGHSGTDEAPTQSQISLTSSDTGPFESGFRKALRVTNGNQTSGLGASDYIFIETTLESQDIANSGWDYTSSSSYLSLSFWVRSSVAREIGGYMRNFDGTAQKQTFTTGNVSANTWTKKTLLISGNSDLEFADDNTAGYIIQLRLSYGSTYTSGSANLGSWVDYASGDLGQDGALGNDTWYTTNDATYDITGVQLEVGSQATAFEHRSFGEELLLSQRYYYNHADGGTNYAMGGNSGETTISENATMYQSSNMFCSIKFPTQMRTKPTLEIETGSNYYISFSNGASKGNFTGSNTSLNSSTSTNLAAINNSDTGSSTGGHTAIWRTSNAAARLAFTAEL